jgi:hypothetical protein
LTEVELVAQVKRERDLKQYVNANCQLQHPLMVHASGFFLGRPLVQD